MHKTNSAYLACFLLFALGTGNARADATNVALGKPATQSSNYLPHAGHAELAVDGVTVGAWSAGSTTHTQREKAWWEVDLQQPERIVEVVLHKYTDGGLWDRLAHYSVQLFDAEGQLVAERYHHGAAAGPTRLTFGGVWASRVRVRLLNDGWLSLAEVEVFARSALTVRKGLSPRFGNTYEYIGGGSAQECERACENDARCVNFYHYPDVYQNGYCMLMDEPGTPVATDPTSTMGTRPQPLTKFRITEGRFKMGRTLGDTTYGLDQEQCAQACFDDPDCNYFAHGGPMACTFLDGDSHASYEMADYISGAAIAPNPAFVGVVGGSRSVRPEEMIEAYAEEGLDLGPYSTLRPGQCTVVYVNSEDTDPGADFGLLTCSIAEGTGVVLKTTPVHGGCDGSWSTIADGGTSCRIGVGAANFAVQTPYGQLELEAVGPQAGVCGNVSSDRVCGMAGAELSKQSFKLRDPNGHGLEAGVYVGVGVGGQGAYEDGVLSGSFSLGFGMGVSMSMSLNVGHARETVINLGERGFTFSVDAGESFVNEGAPFLADGQEMVIEAVGNGLKDAAGATGATVVDVGHDFVDGMSEAAEQTGNFFCEHVFLGAC